MGDSRADAPESWPSVESTVRRGRDLGALIELTGSLASSHDIHEILFLVVSKLAALLRVDRGSIVLVDGGPESATVVATSDDAEIRSLSLALEKYPEIREVLQTAREVVIDDVRESALLRDVLRDEGPLEFASMALVPIVSERGPIAVLCLRGRSRMRFSEEDLEEARVVANATAIALNNARILRSLRRETAALRREDERRLAELERYFDFFESSADAMVVMDVGGRIFFANPTARELLGFDASDPSISLDSLVCAKSRDLAQTVVRGFRDGVFPVGVDLLVRSNGGLRTACVNFSGVLRERDAVLATMRDVTLERELARELSQTKEFLERMIDSSVDSIVSADLRGNVLLFNRAAVKLFGYAREEVVGIRNVETLYPEGIAREVMQRIRSPEFGGKGRLEDYRVDMLSRTGERIPVSLSAALIVDGGKAVGSLGIFTDIREKLAMESQLLRAEQERKRSEKQSAIAELAGAAAHELNQPLTSVLGYTEYLKRLIGADPNLGRALDVIQSEAERMAEIVRKVGRITRYETMPYVGTSRIFDLDRASRPVDGSRAADASRPADGSRAAEASRPADGSRAAEASRPADGPHPEDGKDR